ncbi:Uncharacterized protein APZ42_030009 [Daphnia magna]|uniref:Uncharacterized protein n=1 Tax=Daphnia magna TaxID=35525 RepID=A0A164P4V1_9CRUS|nr:Uncharacterized protein APZ42_030009 [Daphnia magna]
MAVQNLFKIPQLNGYNFTIREEQLVGLQECKKSAVINEISFDRCLISEKLNHCL